MHVKHIILDGFKSYKERTDIGPFDSHFNAITGLNGSGKSNILDAIAFVLGLSSLGVVRACNLGDLIYKGGGGVSRASASIVFDNSDKSQGKCPVGYEKFDEIIVSRTVEQSGQCKFFLNSITSTKKAITDLFESVQLNITNPNFMIMQGKITKVIGMTPKQILAMVEETVGGNVYQTKRDKAEQELENKERCLATTQSIIDETINPEYKRLKEAQHRLKEFIKVESHRNKASQVFALVAFNDYTENLTASRGQLEKILQKDAEEEKTVKENNKEIENCKRRQQQMKKENTDKFKDQIEKAEKALNDEKKIFLKGEAQVTSAEKNVTEAQTMVVDAEKAKKEKETEMTDYKKKSSNSVNEFEGVKAEIEKAKEELAKAREQENAIKLGNIVDEDGKACDARQELMRVEDEINKIEPDFQVGDQQFKEDQQKFRNMEQELKRTPSDDQVDRDYNAKVQRVQQLKAEAVRKNINPEENTADLIRSLNEKKQRIDVLEREKQKIWNRQYHLSFQYNKQSVDSTKVLGCVYEHVKFNGVDEWGGALEVLVAGFVGHVLVTDPEVGKALLTRGQLARRMTLHPLSVFQSTNRGRVTQQDLDRKLGPGKATPAIDLIEYDPKFKEVIQQFFGGKVLCEDIQTARKVAYEMRFYSVSKLGDVADPDGIMQGGSRKNLGQLILDCDALRSICAEIKQLIFEVADLQGRVQMARTNEEFMKTLDVAKRDLLNAEATRKLTKHSMLQQEVEALKLKLQQDGEKLKEWKRLLDGYQKDRKRWQTKVDQLENLREKNKKDNASMIAKWEKALETATKKYESKQKQYGDVELEIRSHQAFIDECQEEIEGALAEKARCEKILQMQKDEFATLEQKFQKIKNAYDAAVAESQQWNAEYNEIEEAIREYNNENHRIDVEKIKRTNDRTKLQGSVEYYAKEREKLVAEHRTIDFAKEDVPEEFAGTTLNDLKHQLASLNKKHEDLRLHVDLDATERLESTKKAKHDAEYRMKKVESNRENLKSVIHKLDDHKKERVMTAYDRVNSEFGKMMSTLLPESTARLDLVNKNDLNDGLNIRVRLGPDGSPWKESLNELSGGQRSLVALALVLSLCMYNSAPFYILDEIDSALDLNHTQNIGVLIKRRFTGTQFICVSLKDGMYANCNVLFQVQFLDGKSCVKRCVRSGSRKNAEEEEAAYKRPSKKKLTHRR